MPPQSKKRPSRSLRDLADESVYPLEAFDFVQRGVPYTVQKTHGDTTASVDECRHVSGQDLCLGLRDLALRQWGLMARLVLRRWNITSTLDFGRIVFHLVEGGYLRTTEDDTLDDFRHIFDFRTAFEEGYRIDLPPRFADGVGSGTAK